MSKTKRRYPFEPDYAVPPGATLQETIDALHMTQTDLATRTGLTPKTVNLIIKGQEPISHTTAVALERATGVPARMWNTLESNYREQLARIEDAKQLAARVNWLERSGIPVRELVRRGVLEAKQDAVEQLQAVLSFFGVRNIPAWEATWARPASAYRKSSRFTLEPGATATWLRLGEVRAREIQTEAYDRDAFRSALDVIRKLTVTPPETFEPEMITLCARAGVAVALVPPIKGCPAYGAARWLSPSRALIQLSLRGKYEDLLWFTFFHEAAHILNDPKKPIFLDDGKTEGDTEKHADRFAADFLIPPEQARQLDALRGYTAVERFAGHLGISPGIVVGRMQHEGIVPRSHYNKIRRRFGWKSERN